MAEARLRAGDLIAAVFPLAAFAAAMFFLLGDWGPYNDDWVYIHRDPGTGEIQSLIQSRPIHLFRPLYRVTVPPMATLLRGLDWVQHLITVAAHGGAALLVGRLLRGLGLTRLAAALGAMLFAFYPVHFEVVFWPSALPTTLSTCAAIVAMLIALRHARGQAGWWATPAIGVLAFAGACWNEQPPCILAGLPGLYLAVRSEGVSLWHSLRRSIGPSVAAATAMAAYVALHMSLGYRGPAIGHDALTVPLDEMPRALKNFLYWLRGRHMLHDFSRPATVVGLATISAYPARAAVLGAAVALSVVPWVARMVRRGDERTGFGLERVPRVLPLLGASLGMLAGGYAPVVLLAYWLMPRMAYAPTVGLALLVATGVDAASRHAAGATRAGVRWRVVAASTAALLTLAFTVMLIGVQRMFQKRTEQDAREAGALKAMLPSPVPGTVFAPVRAERDPGMPGAEGFDVWFYGAFNSAWSAPWVIRFTYGRADLGCGRCWWNETGFLSVDDDRVAVRFGGHIAWDRLVPFVLERGGGIRLVDTVIVEREDGSRREYPVPQVRALDREALVRAGFSAPIAFHQGP